MPDGSQEDSLAGGVHRLGEVVPNRDPPADHHTAELDGGTGQRHRRWMNELLVGYARVSTEQQDLTAQRNGLHALGVGDDPSTSTTA